MPWKMRSGRNDRKLHWPVTPIQINDADAIAQATGRPSSIRLRKLTMKIARVRLIGSVAFRRPVAAASG
jgi:hypothetical protein